MKVIWAAKNPLAASDIVQRLSLHEPWHPKTVKTLLSRLVKKRALAYQVQGREYLYEPLETESTCIKAVSESFLERVFGGSIKPMLAHFVANQKLTKEEIKELKKLLETKE